MKLQDKFLYMTYGAGLVVLGMVLNALIDDADAQGSMKGASFEYITCNGLGIMDGSKVRVLFVLQLVMMVLVVWM